MLGFALRKRAYSGAFDVRALAAQVQCPARRQAEEAPVASLFDLVLAELSGAKPDHVARDQVEEPLRLTCLLRLAHHAGPGQEHVRVDATDGFVLGPLGGDELPQSGQLFFQPRVIFGAYGCVRFPARP